MAPDAEANTSQVRPAKRKQESSSRDGSEEKKLKNVSTACDQCKKRKVKCNGETPCRRCHNLSLPCIYVANSAVQSLTQSSDFKQLYSDVSSLNGMFKSMKDEVSEIRDSQLSTVEERLELLEAEIIRFKSDRRSSFICSNRASIDDTPTNSNSNSGGRIENFSSPWAQPLTQRPDRRKYRGPTSSTYDVDVAKTSLNRMGISGGGLEEMAIEDDEGETPPEPPHRKPSPLENDPLYRITLPIALDALSAYDEACNLIYPIVDMQWMAKHVEYLYSADRDEIAMRHAENTKMDQDTGLARIVLALGCLLLRNGHEEAGQALYNYMEPIVSVYVLRVPSIDSLIKLTMMATYLFHTDDEAAAWRVIGIAGRACYELGLHRREILNQSFSSQEDSNLAVKMFWVVYALDRRWAFGSGMPFAIQDADVDETLPEPPDDGSYLRHITRCNKIMSKIWAFNREFDANNVGKEADIGFLEYQVQQWYQQLPDSLKLDNDQLEDLASRRLYKVRLLLRLRANLGIIHIYRPILHSATNIHRHLNMARRAVDVARETISILVSVNQLSTVYRDQQVLYNYFLVQALAVIFLAISHAPAEFLNHTRKEFFEVLDLVKGFSMKSSASRRLWNTIQELKRLRDQIRRLDRTGSTISIPSPTSTTVQPSSNPNALQQQQQHPPPTGPTYTPHHATNLPASTVLGHKHPPTSHARVFPPTTTTEMDGMQMSNDLLTLFEGVGDASFTPALISQTNHMGQPLSGRGSTRPSEQQQSQRRYGSIVLDTTAGAAAATGATGAAGGGIGSTPNSALSPTQISPLPGLGAEQDGFTSIWTELL